MRHLPASVRIAQPWKNGGGVTREVAVSPPDSGVDDFDWRVSIAEVVASGPFSRFDGIDRVLAVLAGTLELAVGHDPAVILSIGSDPLHFAGEMPAIGTLPGASVWDCNLMLRRDRYKGAMFWSHDLHNSTSLAGTVRIIVALADTKVVYGQQSMSLAPWDAVLVTGSDALSAFSNDKTLLIIVEKIAAAAIEALLR